MKYESSPSRLHNHTTAAPALGAASLRTASDRYHTLNLSSPPSPPLLPTLFPPPPRPPQITPRLPLPGRLDTLIVPPLRLLVYPDLVLLLSRPRLLALHHVAPQEQRDLARVREPLRGLLAVRGQYPVVVEGGARLGARGVQDAGVAWEQGESEGRERGRRQGGTNRGRRCAWRGGRCGRRRGRPWDGMGWMGWDGRGGYEIGLGDREEMALLDRLADGRVRMNECNALLSTGIGDGIGLGTFFWELSSPRHRRC